VEAVFRAYYTRAGTSAVPPSCSMWWLRPVGPEPAEAV